MPIRSRRIPALLIAACATVAAALPSAALASEKTDRIVIFKAKRELQLLHGGVLLKSYPIALGWHPKGAKRRRGDGKTPEGLYFIDGRIAHTPYHLALHLSYPNELDLARARRAGRSPGGDILIHGMPARFCRTDPVRFFRDWTNGCIAVGNIAIEEIWAAADDGTAVEIRP